MIFSRWFVLLLAVIASGCGSVGSQSSSTISGTVTYKQRVALPPQSEVIVTLEDVSRAGAAATIVSETRFQTEGKQVPLEFAIDYSPEDIQANHTYVIRAKIKLLEQLIYTSDSAYRVLTDPEQTHHIDMDLVPVAK